MSRTVSQISALALVVCFVLCQPAGVAASVLSLTLLDHNLKLTGPSLNKPNYSATPGTIASERPTTKSGYEKSEDVSAQKTLKKDSVRSKVSKRSKKASLKSGNTVRKLAHHRPLLDDAGDCNACHDQCLLASAACIALSIITACPACGLVCLVYQAGCQTICNDTTACKNAPLNN